MCIIKSRLWGESVALKDLVLFAFEKAEKMIEKPVMKTIDFQYRDKKIIKEVRGHLLKKYGNEIYYNALDSYLTLNHVIESLIPSIRGESNVQPEVARRFKSENVKKFLRHNPEYKNNKVVSSRVLDILGEIFDIVQAKVLALDPHSDLGRLQRSFQVTGENLSDEHQRMDAKLDSIGKGLLSVQAAILGSGISDTMQHVGANSEGIDSYVKRIKEVETTYQKEYRYHTALNRYYALLQEIVTKLEGHPQEQIHELVCTINCNIALCQSNLGLYQEAFNSLSAIPDETASKSKIYHFVYALVYVHQADIDNYQIALDHINTALSIEPDYHNAFSFKQFLLAHVHPDQIDSIVQDMDEHYCSMVAQGVDHSKLAEHYQFRGLINLYADRYADAIENFHRALEYGCEPMTIKFNIAVAMYAEASKAVPKDCRLLAPDIDQKTMMKAVDALKEVIDLTEENADFEDIRRRAVSIYISACSSLGKKHELSPVDDYLYEGQDYEQLRGILLGSSEKVTEAQLSLLSSDDRLFYTAREMMEQKDADACHKCLSELVDKGEQRISAPVYHILLQVCLIIGSTASYWRYRHDAADYGITGDLLESMDACAYELDGDIPRAKEIFDTLSVSSAEDNILENTLRFFLRNNFRNEAKTLFERIHGLIVSESMYVKDVELFYQEANKFFIAEQDDTIQKILSELPEGLISPKCRAQLFASFYSATNDSKRLYECLSDLDCVHDEFINAFNMALCAARLFKYGEALNICYDLEKRVSTLEERVKLYWLTSDILLLSNDKQGSFNRAKEAHELTSQNPYDRSHQAYFSRAFRCNRHDALKDIVEYQKVHPVVVDWIKTFSIQEGDDDILSTLKNAIGEFGSDHIDYEKQEEHLAISYKQGVLPIHAVWERYNRDLLQLFAFASKNKLNIALGNIEMLTTDISKIRKNIVVDALSLIIMAYHGCLDVLASFEDVYVNCRSVATIQQLYLSYEYPFVSDILAWLESAGNIVFKADGFVDEESTIVKLFSADFMACCNIATDLDVPFLYCDVLARKLQTIPESGILPTVEFVSIPAVCNKFLAQEPQRLSDVLYSLLKNATFISFRAETILHQIRKQNYAISKELIYPFMFCDTSCDMSSFANVYLLAIRELYSENTDAASTLACIVLEDALRIWRQGTYYRLMKEKTIDFESSVKAATIEKYVREVLQGIKRIFGDMKGALSEHFDALIVAIEKVT